MIVTALIALGVLGAVISWDRHLPRSGESRALMSTKRKIVTALGLPVGLTAAVVAFVVVRGSDGDGFYETLATLTMAMVGCGGIVVAGLTAFRWLRSRR